MVLPGGISQRKPRVLVICIGNAYRGDDAVGLIVLQRLREEPLDHVTILEESSAGVALIDLWQDTDVVILIDAVCSGAEPGTLYRFEAHTRPLPTEFSRYSTHAFSVAETIELARSLDRLPPCLIVYGIEGRTFEMGALVSSKVEKAGRAVTQRVLWDLEKLAAKEG